MRIVLSAVHSLKVVGYIGGFQQNDVGRAMSNIVSGAGQKGANCRLSIFAV